MKKEHIFLCLCLSFLVSFVFAMPTQAQQTQNVQGTVVDETGEPIIGAFVRLVGAKVGGTQSDMNGKFSIVAKAGDKITISYIGYVSQTIADLKNPRVVLKEDLKSLNEVVVVGYGTQKMKNVTGAITTVSPQEISDLSGSSLGSALSGKVNGLSVSGGNGRPGDAATMSIRQASVATMYSKDAVANTPLYVIDGFVTDETAFNNLDPSMIENISVLKDASAAVYGARSALGVILVQTKRGKVGAPKISYNGQFGYTDAVSKPKMLDSYNYGLIWNAVQRAATMDRTATDTDQKLRFQADELEAMKGLNYDLLDKYWSSALTQKHSINISGGSENATYFAGVSYFTQDGNLGRIDYDRWNFRAGVDAQISKWVKGSLQVSGDYGNQTKAYSKVGGENGETDYNFLLVHPRYIPEYVNGLPIPSYGITNAVVDEIQQYHFGLIQDLDNYSKSSPQNMTLNTYLEYDFGKFDFLKGLKAKVSYSKAISNTKGNQYASDYTLYAMNERGGTGQHLYTGDNVNTSIGNFSTVTVSNGNFLRRTTSRSDSYQLNFIATYNRKFGLHDLNGLFSIERSENETEDLTGTVLDPYTFTDGQSNSATGTQSTSFGRSEGGMLSYIGRVNYSYADKYLLEFLVRSDASTKFAPENYWGVFPSLSLGWVMSEENWFKERFKGLDFFKLRGSVGLLGKDNFTPWGWLLTYNLNSDKGPIFGTSSSTSSGATIQLPSAAGGIPNREAHWDKSYKTNFGVDIRTINDRLSVTLDSYYEFNRDVFMKRENSPTFPSTVGAQPSAENYGSINMYGAEISLGWKDKIGKDFKYFVKLNTGYNDNKILVRPYPSLIPYYDNHPGQRSDVGSWGMECIGMFRSYQDIEEYFAKYNITNYMGMSKDKVRPGMLIYKDVRSVQQSDGSYLGPDGIVSSTDDMVRVSDRSNPYGFTLNFGFDWKGLSFSAQMSANWGGYSYIPKDARSINNSILGGSDYSTMAYNNLPSFWANNMFVYDNVTDLSGNIVASENRDAKYPNLAYSINNLESTFWRVSGTRVQLSNLTVAYALPKAILNKIGIDACRLNLTGQNLLSFYNPYPDHFIDPMMNYGAYPTLRKFTLGVNVSF